VRASRIASQKAAIARSNFERVAGGLLKVRDSQSVERVRTPGIGSRRVFQERTASAYACGFFAKIDSRPRQNNRAPPSVLRGPDGGQLRSLSPRSGTYPAAVLLIAPPVTQDRALTLVFQCDSRSVSATQTGRD